MVTLFMSQIRAAATQLSLSPFTFGVLLLVIMMAMVLFMYFISFVFGYYLVKTRALTPPKMRITLTKPMEGFVWKLKAFFKRLS